MKIEVKAEWDQLHEVMIHTPGIEVTFGLLEPGTFLYERHFSYKKALEQHKTLLEKLDAEKVKVYKLRDLILEKAGENEEIRNKLISIAVENKRFEGKSEDTRRAEDRFERSIEERTLDLEHFFDMITLNPTVRLYTTEVICREPLANLMFVRDQQAVGDKGVIFGRMREPIRRKEVSLTKLAFEALGLRTALQVGPTGFFEGGDFLPMKKFALIGIGSRTNMTGVKQILNNRGLGFGEVGVVSWPKRAPKEVENDPLVRLATGPEPDPQVCMHLDTYLNVAAQGVIVGYEPLLKTADLTVYQKSGGQYNKAETMKLINYLQAKDFHIIKITALEQMCYASNFLCIKSGTILAVDVEKIIKPRYLSLLEAYRANPKKYRRILNQFEVDYGKLDRNRDFFPNKKELQEYKTEVLDISALTGGYGGIHCLTCALSRC